MDNENDEVNNLIWKIEDTMGTWDESVAQINKVLLIKAEEAGISKSKFAT